MKPLSKKDRRIHWEIQLEKMKEELTTLRAENEWLLTHLSNAANEITALRANQVVWKFPPFAAEDLPKVGDLVVFRHFGNFYGATTIHCSSYALGCALLGSFEWSVISAFCVIPKPPTKTGEGV
jgi:hypothetical protein